MTGEIKDDLVNVIITRVIARFLALNQTYRSYPSLEAAMENSQLAAAVDSLSGADGGNGVGISELKEVDWKSMRSLLAVVTACASEVGQLANAIDSMINAEGAPDQ